MRTSLATILIALCVSSAANNCDAAEPRRLSEVHKASQAESIANQVANGGEHNADKTGELEQESATRSAAPLASALYRSTASTKNPYGDLHSKRGLWPYKPGQKYDRKNERGGGGLLNGLFGG